MPKKWESYEQVATYLLNQFASEFGLEGVEGKQRVEGKRSGTSFVIHAKGVREGNEGFVIVECRRYTKSKQNQERMAAIAYRILDTGAEGGILVSPLGLQKGAAKIASAENVHEVHLDENSTRTEYFMRFLNTMMVGLHERIGLGDEFTAEVIRNDSPTRPDEST